MYVCLFKESLLQMSDWRVAFPAGESGEGLEVVTSLSAVPAASHDNFRLQMFRVDCCADDKARQYHSAAPSWEAHSVVASKQRGYRVGNYKWKPSALWEDIFCTFGKKKITTLK